MMTKKPQKTDLQQEDHHPRAYGSMMLAAKEEVEKEKGKEKADRECFLCGQKGHFKAHCPNRWCVPKTQWSSWWNTLPFQKGKAKGKGKDWCKGGKSKGKGKDQFFYKGQGKGFSALEYPDQEPWWSEESWSAEDVAWNPIGAVSKVKTRCNVSGVLPVEKVPIRIMQKNNTAVNGSQR